MTDKIRCAWCGSDPLYMEYHDVEWGTPVYEDQKLFEFLILETFQAGLSWLTILRKRENFRKAFDSFDYNKVAKYKEEKIGELMMDAGIIRHAAKIKATITNAAAFMEVQKEFGSFSKYIWNFTAGKPIVNSWKTLTEVPATTPLSDQISRDLKQRGFKFVGSTVICAYMQATGMVDDHVAYCWKRTSKS